MTKTVTVQGLAWDQIAKNKLGSEYAMHKVIAANLKARGVLLFSGDIEVAIPQTDEPRAKTPTESLPPWERNA